MLGNIIEKKASVFVTVLLLAFCVCALSYAETLTETEQSRLNSVRDEFVRALSEGDHEVIVQIIPPRILLHLADEARLSRDDLASEIVSQMALALKEVSFSSVKVVTEGAEVTRHINDDGDVYIWGFAPTYFEIDVNGQKHIVEGHTLVLQDADDWYLVRTSELQQISILREVYPFFKEVAFPGASMPATE